MTEREPIIPDSVPEIIGISSDTESPLTVLTCEESGGGGDVEGKKKRNFFLSLIRLNDKKQLVFLQNDNIRDIQLLRCLILKKPWAGRYGQVTKLWEETAEMCMEQRDSKGASVFSGNITGKVVKDRFKALLKWVKSDQNSVQFRSGTDDEEAPGEMMQLLEELAELYSEYEENKETTGKDKAEN